MVKLHRLKLNNQKQEVIKMKEHEIIESLANSVNASNDEAKLILEEAKGFYDLLEGLKSQACPLAMSLAMASQLNHINTGDQYELISVLDDISCGSAMELSWLIAGINE